MHARSVATEEPVRNAVCAHAAGIHGNCRRTWCRHRDGSLFPQLLHLDWKTRDICTCAWIAISADEDGACADGRAYKLEDLFVTPDARNMGVGKAFFAELAKVAQEKVHPYLKCMLEHSRTSHARAVRGWTGQFSR